ncbi:hypothetical protein JHK82_048375 [Glycine max]|nr:hypothetical protein JHK82_048375 [Glycine max]
MLSFNNDSKQPHQCVADDDDAMPPLIPPPLFSGDEVFDDVINQVDQMIQTLVQLMRTLEKIPEEEVSGIRIIPNGEIALRKMSMIISSIIQQMSGLTTVWENKDGENSRLQDSHEVWQEDGGFQEAVENWLGGPSDHESAPVGRIRGFYFPEDDNVYSVELRELLNRRNVSNLLRSSFRESLDQLI